MSLQRLLLLICLCLCFLCLSVVPLTRASGDLSVNEKQTRFLLHKDRIEILFGVENTTGETRDASIRLELIDTKDDVLSETFATRPVAPGSQTLKFNLPQVIADLSKYERRELLWYRLRYRMVDVVRSSMSIDNGIISLSEIMPDMFEIRVATSMVLREGGRYQARVQARNPFTHQPVAGVDVKGAITIEDEDSFNPTASGTTDKAGYALLNFVLPANFAANGNGELRVIGTRDGVVSQAEGEIFVDGMARNLITTDKGLYQPGQTIHIRAVLFGAAKRAHANQNALIRIVDPEGVSVFVANERTSRYGVVNADWQIPDNVRLGNYHISVDREGEEGRTSFVVRISRYDLPNFSVTVEPDQKFYLPGQKAKVKVRADYLFGQPVKRGVVRVVEENSRNWNFRQQRWAIDEGPKYEGQTDAQGTFAATIDLASAHDALGYWEWEQFKDLTYCAYFTDPTTNRTEQRRFTLRATKEAIHVYIVNNNSDNYQNRHLPLQFYVSTFYADGTPASCKVDVSLVNSEKPTSAETKTVSELLNTIRTNRYGLAKANIRLNGEFADRHSVRLQFSATDTNRRSGLVKQRYYLEDQHAVLVDTPKSLYRAGEPIIASITSNLPNQTLVVELAKDSSVIRSTRVQLRDGRATASFPYAPNLTGLLTVAAYPDFADSERQVGVRSILYPQSPDLNVNIKSSQATYRPGDDARVSFSVRTSDGRAAESALGVVVLDKAVEERMRTDAEFGGDYQRYNTTVAEFLGIDQQFAGVTFRDLQRLDMRKVVAADLDLVADLLINQSKHYYPLFYRGQEYDTELAKVFAWMTERHAKPVYNALHARFQRTQQYPTDEKTLREFLREAQIDLQQVSDPWGMLYRPVFSTEERVDVFRLMSGGADKRFGTDDDFSVLQMNWEYFIPLGRTIQGAVNSYHRQNKGLIRDRETLRAELARAGFSLDQLRDRWGQPYHFDFVVHETNYEIQVNSSGPDRTFSTDPGETEDDFTIWTASIDYFAERRQEIEKILNDKLESSGKFPQSESEFREALRGSNQPFEGLRDPWNRPYYPVFKTESHLGDRAEVENRAAFGNPQTMQTRILPVTRTVAHVTLKSSGEDGQEGTRDDFAVASFSRVIKEQARGMSPTKPANVVLSNVSGVIHGVITDAAGALVAGAKITATRTPDIHRYHALSNDNGAYVLKDLPPGLYEVRFEAPGFVISVITNVLVRISTFTQVDTVLQAGAVNEAVNIIASGNAAINTSQVSHSVTASRTSRPLPSGTKSPAQISTPRLREYFPETLVWQPSIETDARGQAEIKFKLADNITTWKMAVIGSTEDGRIGTGETEFKAFQPFFVEHDPPRILTEGDEISLPVVVRNYLDRIQKVDLEIKTENWFALLGPARMQTSVAPGDAARETFAFRAVSSGADLSQRITAVGSNANDAIEKPVTIHPDGQEVSLSDGDILTDSAGVELEVPESALPNSTRAELKIYPNLMAHVIDGVEGIMQRPHGCAEQTISSSYPSLLLLRHHKQTGADFALRTRAQRYLHSGYTRLLSYRDEDGGFGYWNDANPDMALTAYAIRFLTDAADVIEVDREIIRRARLWLLKQQGSDGSWAPHQSTINDRTQLTQRATLTAYVARILGASQAKMFPEDEGPQEQERSMLAGALRRAVDFLAQRSNEVNDSYFLASYALALIELGDAARAKPVIEKLRSLGHAGKDGTYWSVENTPFYGWGFTGQLETTALVVQALSRYCTLQEGNCAAGSDLIKRGLLFLFANKDRHGVWFSTQTTVTVLDTLALLFAQNKSGREPVGTATAQIEINGRVVQTVNIPESRTLAAPTVIPITSFLSSGKNQIQIKRSEAGALSSVQVLANYYAPWKEGAPNSGSNGLLLITKFDKTEGKVGDSITCNVEVARVGSMGFGMLLAEIGMPPGADVDRNSLEKVRNDGTISQYDVLPDRIVLYIWPRADGVKFDFQFRPRIGIAAKTAPSQVYDYYNPEARAVLPPVKFRIQ